MSLTNFSGGIASFGVPVLGILGDSLPVGKVFFVHATTGKNNPSRGEDPDNPFASLAYAIGRCRDNKGDVIILLPTHSENCAVAAGINVSKKGVSVIGVGRGDSMPKIVFTANAATMTVASENFYCKNVWFDLTGGAAVATPITVSKANCTFDSCTFEMADTGGQCPVAVTGLAGGDRMIVKNCKVLALTAGAASFYKTAVALTQCEFINNEFWGDFSVACIHNITAAVTLVKIIGNVYYGTNASEPMVELLTASTGVAAFNLSGVGTMAANASIIADAVYKFQNYITDSTANSASSGVLDPTAVTL